MWFVGKIHLNSESLISVGLLLGSKSFPLPTWLRQTLDLASQKHWEHGYASTIYSAQGKTTDEVLINIDTRQKSVMGHEAWYVAISRARLKAHIYTNDAERLPDSIKRVMSQESALEAVERDRKQSREVVIPQPEPKVHRQRVMDYSMAR